MAERDMLRSKGFQWKPFLRNVAVIAIPVALQNLLTTTASMIDVMMIAPLGEISVGAVGLCAQFSSLMFSCYWGFVGGGILFFSQYFGAGDDDGINRSYGITLTCMMLVAFAFTALTLTNSGGVMGLYTDKPAIQAAGAAYLRIVGFAYPFQVLSVCMSALLRTTGRVRIPLIGSVCSVITNIFLNWVLIGGNLGLPAMGVRGAALATVLAGCVNTLVILLLAKASGHPYLLRVSRHFRWSRATLAVYLRKCFPIIMNELLIGVGNMVINVVLGRQSEQAIAATAVFRTLEGFVIGFFVGFANAASVLVGTEVGAGNLESAYQRARRLLLLCAGVIFLACLLLLAVHGPLLTAMSLKGESYDIGFGMLAIYCAAAVIRMSNWTQNETFRSAGDAAYGTILEISFMYVVLLPCVYLAGMVVHLPFLMIFACCYIDEPIRFLLMLRHLRSGRWIKPVTPQGKAALPEFLARHDRKRKCTKVGNEA